MKNDKPKASLTSSIALLIVAIVVIGFAFKQQADINKQQANNTKEIKAEVQQAIKDNLTKPSDYPDFDSVQQLKKVTLVSNFVSYTPSSSLNPSLLKRVVVLEKGELAKAYVYIMASLDGKALTQWESIYLTMNWNGGHLYRPQSLPVPPSDKTRLLYAINSVPYLTTIPYNERNTPQTANWFGFFHEGSSIQVDTFISSLRPALMDELTIYYQCVKDTDCLLTIK